MHNKKWLLKRYGLWLLVILILIISGLLWKNWSKKSAEDSVNIEEKENEKGYDLPVDETERREAEQEMKIMIEAVQEIYRDSFQENTIETIDKMVDELKQTSIPVVYNDGYSEMYHYQKIDAFLADSKQGKEGEAVLYEVHNDGGLGRKKFVFDGQDMYILYNGISWDENADPISSEVTYTRIKEWKYTDKGWFCYDTCVPEPPEVTEIVDGSNMLRIIPMKDEYREITRNYLLPLGYQGNNLLCSNWDSEHLEELDYNGIYEYLYKIKYQEAFAPGDDQNGIPKEEFESLIMEYLPVTAEQLKNYAVFDETKQMYGWNILGCGNYAPSQFGTSIPEITDIRENEDGSITLTVDVVCEALCDEAVITHELTIFIADDESFKYLGNKVLDDGLQDIPEYQYRLR